MNFTKYSATGNDFIILDEEYFADLSKSPDSIASLCQRREGVGADGLLFYFSGHENFDFKMRYFNADGFEVGMCGNGARALVHYAHHEKKLMQNKFKFQVLNESYDAEIDENLISLVMSDIKKADLQLPSRSSDFSHSYYVEVGVPHTVLFVEDIENIDVDGLGRKYAHDSVFKLACNINFVQILDIASSKFKIRTFERGVEAETLSCGTGITAASFAINEIFSQNHLFFHSRGGELITKKSEAGIVLTGPAKKIYNACVQL